jgi:hypothetical protein
MIPALFHAERVDVRQDHTLKSWPHRDVSFARSPRQTRPGGHCACAFTSSLAIVHALIAGECCEKRPQPFHEIAFALIQ